MAQFDELFNSIDEESILNLTIKQLGGVEEFCGFLSKALKDGSAGERSKAASLLIDMVQNTADRRKKQEQAMAEMSNDELEAAIMRIERLIRARETGTPEGDAPRKRTDDPIPF